MGEPQEAQIWHGLSPPSASSGGGGGEEIQTSGCMGPSMSSLPPQIQRLYSSFIEKSSSTALFPGECLLERETI